MVERATATGAENGSPTGQKSSHRANVHLDESLLENSVPGVVEADEFVTEDRFPLANDCPDHRIQTWTISAAGEHPDSHVTSLGIAVRWGFSPPSIQTESCCDDHSCTSISRDMPSPESDSHERLSSWLGIPLDKFHGDDCSVNGSSTQSS